MFQLFRQPLRDLLSCMETIALAKRPIPSLFATFCAMTIFMFVYVPIHELLHALGCVATGGEVSELQIQAIYGGTLLAAVFPFVVAGGDYAGRLSGFDTHGSDFVYLVTVLAPYLLTVLFGVPLMRMCSRQLRPLLFGIAFVLVAIPFISIPGDYFEVGSIVTTRVASWVVDEETAGAIEAVRSDDAFKLIGQLAGEPGELGLADHVPLAAALIVLSFVVSVLCAFLTYALSGKLADRVVGPEAPARQADPGRDAEAGE
ncbi:MAG: hypothetical protein JRG96_07325 [Deltaproteobacteria bacterium]|nr:hypothetical protein [Deltaproteobacteria bacterium]MBW2418523.1 hypothetical protein [Deltaproteobacteria bacterium]